MGRSRTIPIDKMNEPLLRYYKKKQNLIEETNKAKEKTKREFEAYLNEEMKKYPLGFNPYQV